MATGLSALAFAGATPAQAAPPECSVASNGSFESPNIQDPENPVRGDSYANGYNYFRTSQGTISGWETVAGTIDILRYYSNASDGAQSIDLFGTAPATMQQTFTGLTPGAEYTFTTDYSGIYAGVSAATVSLSQDSGAFVPVTNLTAVANAVLNGSAGVPETPYYTVTWSTYTHTFTATGTSATVRLQNAPVQTPTGTGLFLDNFTFAGGAACQDLGDAPDSYGTTLASDGARHVVSDFDSLTSTAPVMLGATVGLEEDGVPSAGADSDGDDGVVTPLFIASGTASSVSVSATNNSSQDVTLAGWVDLNGDGQFQAAERVTVTVPANSGTASYTLDFPAGTVTADTYARFRVFGSIVADPQPTGNAAGGEVEDYLVDIINPQLTVVKQATPTDVNGNGLTDAGDTIQYTFDVTNTGDVPITDVTVNDPMVGAVTCSPTTLAVDETATCSAASAYTITDADVANGSVENTATASGTGTDGNPITSLPSTTSTTTTAPAPAMTVVKSASPSGEEDFAVGEEITYSFVVTNTGNVPMNDVTVVEGDFTGTGELSPVDCPETTLAVGAQQVCTASYTLTQDDVDAGSVTNSATVEGTPPGGETPTPSTPSIVTIPTPPAPGITVVKTASVDTIAAAGDEVTYSFEVTNTGNVTLTDVAVDEGEFTGTGDLPAAVCPTTTLVPGQITTCTTTYTVTQADIDAGGQLSNTATAGGTPPSGGPIDSTPSTSTVSLVQSPGLAVVKTADVVAAEVGQTVTYSFLVTNTGNVTITDPAVTEGEFTGSGDLSAVTCPEDGTLAPGDEITCTATYTVTQADVDAGALSNTATASGTTPSGVPTEPSPPSTSTVTTDPMPAMSVVKTADVDQVTAAGQIVTYSFLVTNTGNVTITDPTVTEGEFTGRGELSPVTCPEDDTLAPGAEITCTATYTVVAADLAADGGDLSNTATASGTTPGGDTISSTSSTVAVDTVTPPVSTPPTAPAPPAASPSLPVTGSELAGPASGIALLLLALGGTMLLVLRRKEVNS